MGQLKVNDKRAEHQGKEGPGNPEDLKKEFKKEGAALTEVVEIPDPPDYETINVFMQGNRILIQDFPTAEKIGSIFTPNNREIAINLGRIVATGRDVRNLKVGMVISKVFGMGQSLIMENGDKYIFLPDTAAIAIDTRYGMGQEDPQADLKKDWVPTTEIKKAGELV